jgi:hypothetical protein
LTQSIAQAESHGVVEGCHGPLAVLVRDQVFHAADGSRRTIGRGALFEVVRRWQDGSVTAVERLTGRRVLLTEGLWDPLSWDRGVEG